MTDAPRFSLVIPAHDEERLLPRLLDTVDAAIASFGRSDAVEVIVADNMSTDRTAEIAASRGCRVARVEKRVIAAARNGGARVAHGEIVCFVDADVRIHPRTFHAIDEAMATGRVVGGATGLTLERWSLGLAVTYVLVATFAWMLKIDSGVVFCRREDFEAVGGYDERMRIAEDVELPWKLKKLGWKRGQRLVRLRRYKAIACLRKFDEYGDWHYLTHLPGLAWQYFFSRRSANEFIDRYWYSNRS
jgi:glycosyltransferase involved in cell wall biosynthesis